MNKTPPNPGFPIHRLNTAQTRAWQLFPNMRPLIASNIAKKYKQLGVGLLDAGLSMFAIVDPRGKFRLLQAPLTRFEMWQVANAPYHWEECACRNYYDGEVGGAWRERGENAGHHPFCQFSKTAVPVYKKCFEGATVRASQGLTPQARPDEWLKAKENAGS